MSSNQTSQMSQEKVTFSKEAFYSLLNDTAIECNTMCGAGNTTCFKNCVVKSKTLIDVMRDTVLYPHGGPHH